MKHFIQHLIIAMTLCYVIFSVNLIMIIDYKNVTNHTSLFSYMTTSSFPGLIGCLQQIELEHHKSWCLPEVNVQWQ